MGKFAAYFAAIFGFGLLFYFGPALFEDAGFLSFHSVSAAACTITNVSGSSVTWDGVANTAQSGHGTATWTGCTQTPGFTPATGDTFTVPSGVTLTITGNASVAAITMASATAANNLIITNGFTLTVSGALTFTANAAANAQTVTLGTGASGAGNLSVGSVVTAASTSTGASKITCFASATQTGTLTVTGTTASAVTLTGSAVASSVGSSIDMSPGSCNVTMSGTGGGITLTGSGTMVGSATVKMAAGTISLNTGGLVFSGTTAGKCIFNMSLTGGTLVLNGSTMPVVGSCGAYTFTSTTNITNNSGSSSFNYATSVTTWGTCTVTAGTLTFGASQTCTSVVVGSIGSSGATLAMGSNGITDSGNLSFLGTGSQITGGVSSASVISGASSVISGTGSILTVTTNNVTGSNVSVAAGANIIYYSLSVISGANLTIADTASVTVNNNLVLGAASVANSITLGGASASLTVTGTVTHNQPTAAVNSAINVNAGTATFNGLYTMAGAVTTTNFINKLVVTTGTVNMNAGMTFVAAANANHVLDMSGGNGIFNLGAALTMPSLSGTFNMGTTTCTSTFAYNSTTVNQTVVMPPAGNYCSIKILNTKFSTLSLVPSTTLGGDITTTNVKGDIIVGDGSSWVKLTNGGFAITGNATRSFSVLDSAFFDMTATSAFPAGFSTISFSSGSTVAYKQTSGLTITNPSGGYGNLKLAPAGSTPLVFPSGTLTIAGDLVIGDGTNAGATASASNPTINVGNDLTIQSNATFVSTSGTVTIGRDFNRRGTFTHSSGTIAFNNAAKTSNLNPYGTRLVSYGEVNATNISQMYSGNSISGKGQSFTGNGAALDSVVLYLSKIGAPTGTITVNIYAGTGSPVAPTGSILATSNTINVSSLSSTTTQAVNFMFIGANKITLTNASIYVATVIYSGGDANNLVRVQSITSGTGTGNDCSYNGSVWTGTAQGDLAYDIFTTLTSETLNSVSVTTANKTLQFKAGKTYVFNGTFTATGTSENNVILTTDTASTAWTITPPSSSNVSYVTVSWSSCTSSTPSISVSNGTNDGNNGACWSFPALITISGVVRQSSDETTPYGTSVTIRYSVGGAASSTVSSTAVTGAFSLTASLSSGNILTMWLDTNNSGTQGTSILKYGSSCTGYASNQCQNIDIILDRVSIIGKDGTQIDSNSLRSCDNDSGVGCTDTDIGFTAQANLDNFSDMTLVGWSANTLDEIKITSGTTYSTGAANLTTNKLDIAGSFTGDNTGLYAITLTGSGTGNTTTDCTSSTQAPLCITGSVADIFVFYNGASNSKVYSGAYFGFSITPSANGATFTFDSGTITSSLAVQLGDGIKTGTIIDASVNNPNFTAIGLTIKTGVELKAGSGIWTITTNGTPLTYNGTLTANTSTFVYSGAGATTIANAPYYNLTVSGSGAKTMTGITSITNNFVLAGSATATPVITSIGGNLDVQGTAVLTTGANLTVTGNVTVGDGTNVGRLTVGNFTLTVNGTSWIKTLSHFTFGTGAINLIGDVTVDGCIDSAGTCNVASASTGTISVQGNITGAGDIDLSGNTFILSATTAQTFGTTSGSNDWTFLYLNLNQSNDLDGSTRLVNTNTGGTGTITVTARLLLGAQSNAGSTNLNPGNRTWILSGSGTAPTSGSGALSTYGGDLCAPSVCATNTSTIKFTGTATSTILNSVGYYNLEIKPNGTTLTFTLSSGIFTIANNLTIGDATNTGVDIVTAATNDPTITVGGNFLINNYATFVASDVSANPLTIGGNFTVSTTSSTFTHSSGTVIFNATDSGNTIAPNGSGLYNVTFNGAGGTWEGVAGQDLSFNGLTTISAGTFKGGTANIYMKQGATGAGIYDNSTLGGGTLIDCSLSNSGDWIFNTLGSTTSFGLCVGANTVNASGAGSVTVMSAFTVPLSTTWNAGSKTYNLARVGAAPLTVAGTLNADTSTINYTGNGATGILVRGYYNLGFKPSGSTAIVIPTGTFTIGNDLTIGDGTNAGADAETSDPIINITRDFTVSAGATYSASSTAAFTVGRNFTNSGTFTANSGTVNLNTTTTAVVAGSAVTETTFKNLTINTAGKTVQFTSLHKFGVASGGVLTITGTNVSQVTITSTVTSNCGALNVNCQWLMNHQGTEAVTYTTMSYSGCSVSPASTTITMTGTGVVDGSGGGTNGSCWDFGTISITGTLRQSSNESSAYGTVTSIRYSVSGAASNTVNSIVTTGTYTITMSAKSAGTIITLWLDTNNSGVQGTAVLEYGSNCSGSPSCSGIDIILDRVTLYGKDASGITDTELNACDNDSGAGCSDTDIGFTSNAGALTLTGWSANTLDELLIPTGTTFTPSTSVTVQKLDIQGTYSGGPSTLNLSGSGTSATCTDSNQGPLCVGGTFTSFGSTNFSGSSASLIVATAYSTLYLHPGASGPTYTLGAGTFDISGGMILDGGIIDASVNNPTVNLGSVAALTIGVGTELKAGSGTWTLARTSQPITRSGTFTANTSTFVYSSASGVTTGLANNAMTGTNAFYNLTINGTGTFTAGVALEAKKDLIVTAGTLDMGANNLTVGNSSVNSSGNIKVGTSGSFTQQSSATTTVLTPAFVSHCIGGTNIFCGGTPGAITFGNLVIGNGTIGQLTTIGGTTSITVNTFTVSNSVNLTAGSAVITIIGNGTPFIRTGTFTVSTSTIIFAPTSTTGVTIPTGSYYNLTLNKEANVFTTGGNVTVNKDFLLTAGTFTAPSGTLTISGNLINNSGADNFAHNNGTVVFTPNFNSATSMIGGLYGITFNNFSDVTSGSTIELSTDTTYTFSGTITLTGTSNSRVSLKSDSDGSASTIVVSNSVAFTYLYVQDLLCSGATFGGFGTVTVISNVTGCFRIVHRGGGGSANAPTDNGGAGGQGGTGGGGAGYTGGGIDNGGPAGIARAIANIVNGIINSFTVTSGGAAYSAPPAVTIRDTGGGSGAIGTAVLSNGIVVSITVNAGGANYTVATVVTIDAPSVSGGGQGGGGGGAAPKSK